MRGSSAKSLEALLAAVDAAPGASAATIGAELFRVVEVLDREVALRRVLTDPSTEAQGKESLVDSVFAKQVSAETGALLRSAASGRWAAARDLTDGLEIAGVHAWTKAAEDAGTTDELEDELFGAGRVVHGNAELRSVVADRAAPFAGKTALLNDLFGKKISAPALAVLVQAAAARTGSFEKTVVNFTELIASRSGRLVAVARTAYQLSETEVERLAAALAAKYGQPVQLNLIVDPEVVGGISVSVGAEVVDATMSTRLESARRLIAG